MSSVLWVVYGCGDIEMERESEREIGVGSEEGCDGERGLNWLYVYV